MSKAILSELAKRVKQAEDADSKPKFILEEYCFDKQLEFIKDTSKFKTAVCSRRAGKTVSCAADLYKTAKTLDGDVAYITLNRITAKRIIWRELTSIVKKYEDIEQCRINESELVIELPNGNRIYVSGAKDSSEIEKFRGIALRKIYIDECQSFRPYIKELIDDVLEACLTDYDGSLILIGTPGPVPAGYFYDCSTSKGWAHYKWTIHDNPYIKIKSGKNAQQIIEERCGRRGVSINDPSIRREYFGEWIQDSDSLVFKFDWAKNTYLKQPEEELQYIFGIDIGYRDADAIAVLGYSYKSNNVYLIHEYIERKSDITTLATEIHRLKDYYKPVKMVMDAGALGKKIQEEIRLRHGLPVEAAEKQRKLEFIELLNDDLRTGKFKAFKQSRFEEDARLVMWDYENPEKPKISDSYHTDIGDAVLYAWREAKHYFRLDIESKLKIGTDAYMTQLEEKEAEEVQAKKDGNDTDWGVDQDELDSIYDTGMDEF